MTGLSKHLPDANHRVVLEVFHDPCCVKIRDSRNRSLLDAQLARAECVVGYVSQVGDAAGFQRLDFLGGDRGRNTSGDLQ